MNNQTKPTPAEVESTLTEATAQYIAASVVLSAPEKFTQRELAQAKKHYEAAEELLESLGYSTKETSFVEPDPSVPSFLVTLSGKEARIPRKDGKQAWIIPPACYLEILECQYPSYKK
ncbi:hypothetical protein [Pseudomonas aeruginosa]|uniref:hypothetical protein n=1 Tax=Pseudomonas aeruginosa TaxID=287 RepID=UPI0015E65151|nr:hypothetical protein [Pseudomonas aeruginosa]EIU7089572.1 hypothetical protein [Pseudomonas aeruginosa]MBD1253861.1 hypothetical protein [Pseudomonas aeruginosa]MBO2824197.1 hypothetical protein [Pseudomonas aeruginosa]MBR7578046.1 hypothetical protein [Pseudomonas aeruginosa]MBX6128708.1 hypothetical protein [Pseudomonas aeruginosa]